MSRTHPRGQDRIFCQLFADPFSTRCPPPIDNVQGHYTLEYSRDEVKSNFVCKICPGTSVRPCHGEIYTVSDQAQESFRVPTLVFGPIIDEMYASCSDYFRTAVDGLPRSPVPLSPRKLLVRSFRFALSLPKPGRGNTSLGRDNPQGGDDHHHERRPSESQGTGVAFLGPPSRPEHGPSYPAPLLMVESVLKDFGSSSDALWNVPQPKLERICDMAQKCSSSA